MVFSSAFRGAPHTDIATLTYPGGGNAAEEIALLKAVADAFPAVTTVRVREAIDAVGHIVTNLVLAIRGASVLTLLVAALVLGGALAAGHRHRVYDAVILKTVGATRMRLLSAYGLEYLGLGLATALFGVAAGSVAAALVITRVMNLSSGCRRRPAGGRRRGGGDGGAGAHRHLHARSGRSRRRCCATFEHLATAGGGCARGRATVSPCGRLTLPGCKLRNAMAAVSGH